MSATTPLISKHLVRLRKAALLTGRAPWRHGLRHGVAATVEHGTLERLIAPRTVVDIGANKGQFTLFALGAFKGCRVIAFEPLPGPAGRFRTVTARYPQVTLHEVAIGPDSGEAVIHLSQREDSSSLLPMGERMGEAFPEAVSAGRTQRIRIVRLEERIAAADIVRPALLKLDVQGYELEALRGCGSLLGLFDHVYVECSYVELYQGQVLIDELKDHLASAGFTMTHELNRVEQPGLGPIQSDCLFARVDRGGQAATSVSP